MNSRPILFTGPMVRAILDGRKSQTRRAVKYIPALGEPEDWCQQAHTASFTRVVGDYRNFCPHGTAGGKLWVRETFRIFGGDEYAYQHRIEDVRYRATAELIDDVSSQWKPSIFMPRWASRITLEITGVRVERLNAISAEDAIAEGVVGRTAFEDSGKHYSIPDMPSIAWEHDPVAVYAQLWERINGAGSWALNPWVWVISFKRVSPHH